MEVPAMRQAKYRKGIRVKAGAKGAVKNTKLQLRLRPAEKAVLARAAELRRTTVSGFVLEHAYAAAQQVLADQSDIVMPSAEWKAFCEALDAPPRVIPELKRLFERARN
jgi:uncharacterized protein (DUF1778 family)